MENIVNIIKKIIKTYRKSLIIFGVTLISLGIASGVFVYNKNIQKEKELLSRIANLEEQIKEDDELSKSDEIDTSIADSNDTEMGKSNTSTNTNEGAGTQSNSTTTDKKEETTNGSSENKTENVGTSTGNSGNVSGSTISSGIIETDELVVLGSNGIKGINYGRFRECLTFISLTIDNWRDYINVVTYNEEIVQRDAFGEVISSQIITKRVLGVKTNKYYYFENCFIELKNVETQETMVYSFPDKGSSDWWGEGLSEDFNLNNYECTRIKGKICFVDLPKEVIYTPLPEWGYACGFMIIGSGMESPYEIQKEIKRIYPNGAEDWEEKYMK